MAEPICHPHRCRMCSLVCLEGLKFVWRCLEMFGIWESVYLYSVYECIYIYTQFMKRFKSAFAFWCSSMSLCHCSFFPKMWHHFGIVSQINHPSNTGKSQSPGASFWKPRGTRTFFWVNQRGGAQLEASRCFCLRLWVWDVGTLRGLCGEWCALDG